MSEDAITLLFTAAALAWHGTVIAVLVCLHRSERSRKRREARERAELALLAAERALPGMDSQLMRALAELEAEGPLPAWCMEAAASARQEAEQARNDLRSAANRIRALLGPENPGVAPGIIEWSCKTLAADVDNVKAILAQQDARLQRIESAKAEFIQSRREAVSAVRAARTALKGLLGTANAWHREGWPVRGLRRTLLRHCRQAGMLLAQARNPAADNRQAVQQAQALQAEAGRAVDAARQKIGQARVAGDTPIPPHPLFELCRRQEVIIHEGRCYLAGAGGIAEGPQLRALDLSFRRQQAGWIRHEKEWACKAAFGSLPVASLGTAERLVKFVLDDVFPHFRTPEETAYAAADDKDLARQYIEGHAARILKETLDRIPRPILGQPAGPGGPEPVRCPVERATGTGSILIRKDGRIAELVPADDGALAIAGRRCRLEETGRTDDDLAEAVSRWLRYILVEEALREAVEQGTVTLPRDAQLPLAIAVTGKYTEGDHRLEVSGDTVTVFLYVPPFALRRLDADIYHAFPAMEVSIQLSMTGDGRVIWYRPKMMSGATHPYANSNDEICIRGNLEYGLKPGQYIAAYLFMARGVLLSGYKDPSHAPRTGWLGSRHGTVMSKAELDRQGIPVTNV